MSIHQQFKITLETEYEFIDENLEDKIEGDATFTKETIDQFILFNRSFMKIFGVLVQMNSNCFLLLTPEHEESTWLSDSYSAIEEKILTDFRLNRVVDRQNKRIEGKTLDDFDLSAMQKVTGVCYFAINAEGKPLYTHYGDMPEIGCRIVSLTVETKDGIIDANDHDLDRMEVEVVTAMNLDDGLDETELLLEEMDKFIEELDSFAFIDTKPKNRIS